MPARERPAGRPAREPASRAGRRASDGASPSAKPRRGAATSEPAAGARPRAAASPKRGAARRGAGPRATARAARDFPLEDVIETLRAAAPAWNAPVVTFMAQTGDDPFLTLAACILSLRTRDETTGPASARLFERARTPAQVLALDEGTLARLIYPVGFYATKARTLRAIARALQDDHGGQVPRSMDELLALPGVGRKTANLVLTQAFALPGICVDVHVHRIPNRWGLISTRTPEETEQALLAIVPERLWIDLNPTLVAFGQTICQPRSPLCSTCPVSTRCARVGVEHSR